MSAFITSCVTLLHPVTSLGLSFLFCKVGTMPTAPGHWAQDAPATAFPHHPCLHLFSQQLGTDLVIFQALWEVVGAPQ